MPGNIQEKPVKFAGKRLESYKPSVKLFSSDNEYAITDETEEDEDDDEDESSQFPSRRNSKAGKINYHKPKSYKSTLSKSIVSHSSFYHSPDEDHSDSKQDPYTSDSNIHNQGHAESDNSSVLPSDFENLSDFQSDDNSDNGANNNNNDDDDDDEDDDEDEFESDSSNDSATIFLSNETKKQKALKKVKPPRKLVIPAPQRLSLPPKITNLGNPKKTDSSSEFSEMSDSELNALEASIKRRPSIVDHALDERPVFPRSIVGDINEEDEYTSSDESEYNDENLLAILSEDDSDVSDVSDSEEENEELFAYDDDDEADDDNAVEETEERAILEEVKRSGDLEGHKVGYVSDEDDFESDISFDQDAFFETRTTQAGIKSITSAPLANQYSDEDDSYLWSYFFTSGDESEDENLKFNQPTHVDSVDAGEPVEISGDSTDEDENLPRSNLQTISRPTEILSTSANTSRPPVLGSWVMSSERPYGIIDGLTTRTLSTTSGANGTSALPDSVGANAATALPDGKRSQQNSTVSKTNQDDGKSDSELSELALDDFIYTSELEDEDKVSEYPIEDPIYHSLNKDIPLSAFRNRGVQFINRRNSTNNRSQEVHMSSAQSMSKHFRKRRKHKHKHEQEETPSYPAEDIDDLGATDLIDELVNIGAISPLFGGIA
ncbi:hypothetical protein D0Z00_004456 [Geotrichum galactomycetum]|uniref:Uncharacterized protein n=1 Tax=Geotrichum galactomycetum TaxID=27317 RepID=A0ACB6UYD5_9ASCO|nr:hypothetical protein D0Z00_004456 [Geotrichum candidum]